MANSYNELFGIGSHSVDANLEGWWKLDDNAANTTVVDSSGNAVTGTWSGTGNTEDATASSGVTWISGSLNFNGTDHYVQLGTSLDTLAGPKSLIARFYADDATGANERIWGSNIGSRNYLYRNSSNQLVGTWGSGSAFNSTGTLTASTWYSGAITLDGSGNASLYINGSADGSATSQSSTAAPNINIGSFNDGGTAFWDGLLQDCSAWSRALSSTEIAQWHAGPEPTYTSGVSFSADGTYSVGTWDAQSNGTATYEVLAANAAGSVIDSASTSSGDLDLSAENGNTVYLLVRASNTGGYDIGDKATRTSAYGSSNDGYYELASVTASDGAGGGTVQTLALMGAGA